MDQETEVLLKQIVKTAKYKMPGWMIYLGDDNDKNGWLTLHIVSHTPDSYRDDNAMVRVNHSFLVPPATYNEQTWKIWIFERYMDVWRHETGELLEFNGVKEFAPHHGDHENPYYTYHVGDLADTRVKAGETKEDYLQREFGSLKERPDDKIEMGRLDSQRELDH
jgi:hypothetical protein